MRSLTVHGQNKNSDIVSSFAVNDEKLNDETTDNIKRETHGKAQENGCKRAIADVVTGLAGAGKSTAI